MTQEGYNSDLRLSRPASSAASGCGSLWVGAFALSIFLLFHGGHFYHVDEELHFLVANSILEGNWGTIPPSQAAYYRGQYTGTNSFLAMGKFGRGGRFYVHSGIGQALTALPLVALARCMGHLWRGSNLDALKRLVVSFFCPIVAAIAVALLFRLIVELGYPPRAAFAAVCSLAFGTFFFAHAKFFMNHILIAGLLAAGLLCAHRASNHRAPIYLFLSGLTAGWIILTRSDCFTYAVLIPLYWWLSSDVNSDRKVYPLLLMFLGGLLPISILIFWNVVRFSSLFDMGYNLSNSALANYAPFNAPFLTGFLGQLFNLQTGLIWYAAPLLVSLVGFRSLYRSQRPAAITAAASLLLPLLFYAKFSNWAGEISWGPRFLLPALPLLAVASVPVWQQYFESGRFRLLLFVTLVAGVAVQLCGVLADHNRGFVLTTARIAAVPIYGRIPYNRVWTQLQLLRQRPPDLWWVAAFSQGSRPERILSLLLVMATVTLLVFSVRKLRSVLSHDG